MCPHEGRVTSPCRTMAVRVPRPCVSPNPVCPHGASAMPGCLWRRGRDALAFLEATCGDSISPRLRGHPDKQQPWLLGTLPWGARCPPDLLSPPCGDRNWGSVTCAAMARPSMRPAGFGDNQGLSPALFAPRCDPGVLGGL